MTSSISHIVKSGLILLLETPDGLIKSSLMGRVGIYIRRGVGFVIPLKDGGHYVN